MPCGPLLCGGRVPGLLQYSAYRVSLLFPLVVLRLAFNLYYKFMPFWLKHSSFVLTFIVRRGVAVQVQEDPGTHFQLVGPLLQIVSD